MLHFASIYYLVTNSAEKTHSEPVPCFYDSYEWFFLVNQKHSGTGSLILETNDSYDPIFVNQNILWIK